MGRLADVWPSRVSLKGRRERCGSFGVERSTVRARRGAGSVALRLRHRGNCRCTRLCDPAAGNWCNSLYRRYRQGAVEPGNRQCKRLSRRQGRRRWSRECSLVSRSAAAECGQWNFRRKGRCARFGFGTGRQITQKRLASSNGCSPTPGAAERRSGRAIARFGSRRSFGRPGQGRRRLDRPHNFGGWNPA